MNDPRGGPVVVDVRRLLEAAAREVDEWLAAFLPQAGGPEARLYDAMRYAMLGPGKRLRPFLVLECGRLFGVDRRRLLRAGAAIECVHTYSLVHDDLPCMDDDDLRRGRATVHKAFDEATAVLAGDALLTLAFEILADPDTHDDARVRADLALALAKAAGARGMVGGQMLDLVCENAEVNERVVTRLQQMKTGALITCACELGAIMGHARGESMHAVLGFAHDLGLAFQIADDLLDVTGDAAQLGKAVRKDAAAGKATFVALLGVERARAQAHLLASQAARHLDQFGERAALLRAVARFVVERPS
jgi:farnesyl diphosphate synthase